MTFEELRARNQAYFAHALAEAQGLLPHGLTLAKSWGSWVIRRTRTETWRRHPDGSLTIERR